MARLKLLKAPAKLLLLTFVLTAGVAATLSAAPPRIATRPAYGHSTTASVRARVREKIDYSKIEGVQRWGINE